MLIVALVSGIHHANIKGIMLPQTDVYESFYDTAGQNIKTNTH